MYRDLTLPDASAPDPSTGRRALPAGKVLLAGLLALLIGALFNADALRVTAERQELGWVRSTSLALVKPLQAVADALLLDRPRAAFESALGREIPNYDDEREPVLASPPPAPDPAASTTTTTTIPRRAVTAAEPLEVLIVGDSFAELFGPALVNRGADTGLVQAEVDFEFISGLSRPDYFSWPQRLLTILPDSKPDAVVAIFGGNDGQDVAYQGEVVELGSPEWIDLYARRVGEVMDISLLDAEAVYWVGLPIMESDTFTETARMMNAVYQAEADKRPRVTYISSFELFQDSGGRFSTYLDDRKVRTQDGAHFTWNGAYLLADHVLPVIGAEWGF